MSNEISWDVFAHVLNVPCPRCKVPQDKACRSSQGVHDARRIAAALDLGLRLDARPAAARRAA